MLRSPESQKFELDVDDEDGQYNLPPSATDKTKVQPKPTSNLPSDHGATLGEAMGAAFPTTTGEDKPTASAIGSTGMPDAPDECTFNPIYNLLSDSTWLVGAVGVVILFSVGARVFLWLPRRRLQKYRTVTTCGCGQWIGTAAHERAYLAAEGAETRGNCMTRLGYCRIKRIKMTRRARCAVRGGYDPTLGEVSGIMRDS